MTISELDSLRIEKLRENMAMPIENAPTHQIIGTDGSGWYQQVRHEHDKHSNKSDLAEIRALLRQKIAAQIEAHKNRPQQELFRMLELAIVRSDKSLFRLVDIVGVNPSHGLYEQIMKIIVDEDSQIDSRSLPWKLLGVND